MNLQSVIGTGVAGVGGILGGYVNRAPSPYDFSLKRDLHNKSFLEFHFPDPEKLVARLPFYENIDIRENKKANIITYDPIGRSSSLYAYAGASSRSLKLSFFLTLPHIYAMHKGPFIRPAQVRAERTRREVQEQMKAPPANTEQARVWSGEMQEFFEENPHLENGLRMQMSGGRAAQQGLSFAEINEGNPNTIGKLAEREGITTQEWLERAENGGEQQQVPDKGYTYSNYVTWWVNLIRSSVLNNQTDLMQGPPILRLTHGALYNNIPCICRSYDITFEKSAGFDIHTLVSRRIKVNMNLEEFRAGNFGKYDPTSVQPLDRDNVAGWEAVIDNETTDPGFGPSK